MAKLLKHNDAVLFRQIKKGDLRAYEILFERYYAPLCNFAYLFLKNYPQSEEVVSDVLLNIWIKKDEIEIKKSLKSFLYKSTRNAVISALRKNRPQFVYEINELTKTDLSNPETLLLKQEFNDALEDLLGGLPKMSGLVFRMKKVDGLRYKEISEILNISEKTVENHIANAVKKIREVLKKNPGLKSFFR